MVKEIVEAVVVWVGRREVGQFLGGDMENKMVEVKYLECKRCLHRWVPRKEYRGNCPKCKSPYWDRERKKLYLKNV